jgi:CRISPR/Cas system type I-B associated protein Csh2 (Cas7 group RAMP superfamily)
VIKICARISKTPCILQTQLALATKQRVMVRNRKSTEVSFFLQAELIHMRAELVESKAKREVLEQELHNLLLQLHSSQLSQLPDSLSNRKQDSNFKPDVNNIKKKLEAELRQSPIRNIRSESELW